MADKGVFCPYCGGVTLPGARFCQDCGASLEEGKADFGSGKEVIARSRALLSVHMRFFKNDKEESVHHNSPSEVNLETALNEIDNLPTLREFDESFIGFTSEKDEVIQFLRIGKDIWLIDVPVEEGKVSYALQDDDLTTEKVKEIVKRFFLGKDWSSLCNLKKEQHLG